MSATSLRAPEPGLQTRPRVLVADDSRVIRMAIKKIQLKFEPFRLTKVITVKKCYKFSACQARTFVS